jgi:hypothetical protein
MSRKVEQFLPRLGDSVRSEAWHVQECGKCRGIYKSRFSCLLTPFFNSHRRRQARCVSRRCVFRIVAPDQIIFLSPGFPPAPFSGWYDVTGVRNRMRIKQVFRPVIFRNAPCALAREIEFVFPVRSLTSTCIYIRYSISCRFRLSLKYRERSDIITKSPYSFTYIYMYEI